MESPKINIDELCTVRDYMDGDRSFVTSTWLRGYYFGEKHVNEIPKNIFMFHYNMILLELIRNNRICIKIVCLKEDPNVNLAYVAMSHDGKVIHWMFCKAAWRNIGLIKKVIPPQVEAVSHLTTVGRSILKKCPNVKYNPFAFN